MSKLRLNSRRGRWSLVLAILIILATAVAAFAVYGGPVTSQWSNAVGGACVAYDSSSIFQSLSRVKWGETGGFGCPPAMDEAKSGYDFDGETPGAIAPNANFLLGTFTHHNYPIIAGSSITAVDFAAQGTVSDCGVPDQTLTFSGYTFYHDETSNLPDCGNNCDCNNTDNDYDADYCEYGPGDPNWPGGSRCPYWPGDTGPNRNGCADRVTLPYEPNPTTFQCIVDGVTYDFTLWLSAFNSTCNPATPGARYLYTVENAGTSACVYGQVVVPSAITLATFTAAEQGDAIVVAWDTASELDNAGFNLYRDTTPGGPGVKLNADLIASQGPNSAEGFSYSFRDAGALVPGTTYYYRLEDVSLSGAASAHDPVSVIYGGAPNAVGLASFGAASTPAALSFAALALTALAAVAARRRKG